MNMPRNLIQPARTDYYAQQRRQFGHLPPVPADKPRPFHIATSHGAATDGPGATERAHQAAERDALRSIDWGVPDGPDDLELAAEVRAARGMPFPRQTLTDDEAKRAAQAAVLAWRNTLGCEGSLPDGGRAAVGLPTTDFGLLPGAAEGHPLREPRAAVSLRRKVLAMVLAAFLVLLVGGLVGVWFA